MTSHTHAHGPDTHSSDPSHLRDQAWTPGSGSGRGTIDGEPELLESLVQLTLRLRQSGADIESSTGLSGRELDLVALLNAKGPTSVKSLVADLNLPRSTMTAIVDRLQDRGLVKRLPNPQDRRSVILEATPTAIDALLRYRDGMKGFVAHLEAVLDERERTQLASLIHKVAGSF